jgi:hypothetical protein
MIGGRKVFKSCKVLLAGLLCLIASLAQGNTIYQEFNQFCLDNFGAESDSLYYAVFGTDLQFVDSGNWLHESRNSASVGFETSLPAQSYVEYGPTPAYGSSTASTDRYYFLHLHHLTGLEPGLLYYFRIVATDERGNARFSENRTLTTDAMHGAIAVPGSLSGPPYVLTSSNSTYILTQDIVSDTQGIRINPGSTGIILDLNGFTITYDNGTPLVYTADKTTHRSFYYNNDAASVGIFWNPTSSSSPITVRNGTIKQGANNGDGVQYGVGFNPILCTGGLWTIEGLVLDWSGDDVGGVFAWASTVYAHHNIFLDRGDGIFNRHLGVKVLGGGDWMYVDERGWHHNLVKRGRQMVFGAASRETPEPLFYKNEIYVHSMTTNSFALQTAGLNEDNWVFGTGCHAQGVMFGIYSDPMVRNNFIHMVGETPWQDCEDTEHHYGRVTGIRLTQYSNPGAVNLNHTYENNTVLIHVRETAEAHAVRLSSTANTAGCTFRNNTLKIVQQDTGLASGHGVAHPYRTLITTQGYHPGCATTPPVVYEDNTFMSNVAFIHFADGYFSGGSTHFRNNEFIRTGMRPQHYDIHVGANWENVMTYRNRILDATVVGGVDFENNLIDAFSSNNYEYSVGHSLHIIARNTAGGGVIALSGVEVDDNTDLGGFEIETDDGGYARLELIEYSYVKPVGTGTATRLAHQAHTLHIGGYEPFVVTPDLFAISNNGADPLDIWFTPLGELPDTTPPAAVADLSVVSTTQATATLTWTAVGDDGMDGTASHYDIRRHSTPITAENWTQATQISGAPTPGPSGSVQSMVVDGLQPETTYHFAMKVADEAPNWSELSNQASGTTQEMGPGEPTAPRLIED